MDLAPSHRLDSNQGTDYVAILFLFHFKFYMIIIEITKGVFGGELVFHPNDVDYASQKTCEMKTQF